MSPRVFHAPGSWQAGQTLSLDPDETRYLTRVRRVATGRGVEVLDGEGAHWDAELIDDPGRAAVLRLLAPRPSPPAMPLALLLIVPEPRATLDALIHASELAATAVHLVPGDHSPGGLPSAPRIARTLRAAQRQCGRPLPPRVHGPQPLATALSATEALPGWQASVPARAHPTPVTVDPARGARLLVGPEGGLSDAERQQATDAGLRPMGLGPWILRTPTAVAAGLARLSGSPPQAVTGP